MWQRARVLVCFGLAILAIGSAAALAKPGAKPAAKSDARRAATAPAAKSLLDVQLFQLDQAHSSIEFAVQWMGLTKVKGTFSDIRGSIGFDEHDLTRSSITIVINTPSITTWNTQRDKDLKGKSFFDTDSFPTATFASRTIEKTGDSYLMHGALTIKGVTRDVDFPFTYLGQVVDSGGTGHRLGFEGRLTIDRNDYHVIGTNQLNRLTQLGARMIGDKVDLSLSLQGWMFTPAKLAEPGDSLFRVIVDQGMAVMAKNYRQVRAVTPDSLMRINEEVINTMGYYLLRQDRPRDALAMFQLEAESYHDSPFAQVGMGQSYATLGERDLAIASCEKAVALNPAATRALEILRRVKATPGG